MVRGREDDGSESESVLGLAGIGGAQKLPISRRALLYGVTGTSIGAAVVVRRSGWRAAA